MTFFRFGSFGFGSFGFADSRQVQYEDLLPALSFGLSSYDYGEHDTGTNTDYIFTLTNSGNELAEDITVAVTGTGFSLLSSAGPFNIAASAYASITVRFNPSAAGAASGALTVSWPNQDNIVVTLAGTGVAVGDTTPDAFSFTDQTDVAVSTTITSAAITVAGITAGTTITVSGGTYDINGSGTFVSSSGTVYNGDTVRARHTSSASNETATNTVVTIGGVSDTFTSTTVAAGLDWTDITIYANFDEGHSNPYILGTNEHSAGTTSIDLYGSAAIAGTGPYSLYTPAGTGHYARLTVTDGLELSGSVGAVGIRMKVATGSTFELIDVLKFGNNTGNYHYILLKTKWNGGNNLELTIYNGSFNEYGTTSLALSMDTYYNITVGYNYTTDSYKIWVDDTEVLSVTDAYTAFVATYITIATSGTKYRDYNFDRLVVSTSMKNLNSYLGETVYGG